MITEMFPEAVSDISDGDERYTLAETVAECARIAGVSAFTLDVAACAESHHAPVWYDKSVDGSAQDWHGHVWCNPPWSEIDIWLSKATQSWLFDGHGKLQSISMLLPANRTGMAWWRHYVEGERDREGSCLRTHFLPGRTKFGFPGNPRGEGVGSPPFSCVLLVWR